MNANCLSIFILKD